MDLEKASAISIFTTEYQTAEFMKSMRDLASLAGVLKELSTEKMYDSPIEIIRFLNVIQLIHEASLGIKGTLSDERMIYYRYRSTYVQDTEPPSLQMIQRMISILERNNWILKQTHQITLRDRGKRLMSSLIRMGNDALAYYMQDEIERSLFQARRDAEISAAYDDQGISGGNQIASMIYHVEQAVQQLEDRQLELLADRHALPQLRKINQLMEELEQTIEERLAQFQTLEESTIMSDLMQRGTAALAKGTNLSVSVLKKYMAFSQLQKTQITDNISPEKVRQFMIAMYTTEENPNIPTPHDLFSFMEQNKYEGEAMDGIWMPVKFASPIGTEDIKDAVEYLRVYEPKVEHSLKEEVEVDYEETTMDERSLDLAMQDASWKMTKSFIETKKMEEYLKEHGETEVEKLVIQSSSSKWNDAILSLLSLSALTSNQKVKQRKVKETENLVKEWTWIDDGDKRFTVRPNISDDE